MLFYVFSVLFLTSLVENRQVNPRFYKPNLYQQIQNSAVLRGHTYAITSLVYLPNGDLASGSNDKTIKIWNTESRELKKTLVGHTDYVYSVTVLDNGDLASSDSTTIRIWDIEEGTVKKTLTTERFSIYSLTVLPNNQLASGALSEIHIWNTERGTFVKRLTGHTSWVNTLVLNKNGDLISGSNDRTIKIWNWETGTVKSTLIGQGGWVKSLALLPNGLLASSAIFEVLIWDLDEGRIIHEIEIDDFGNALALTSTGDLVVDSSKDLHVYDTITWKRKQKLVGHTQAIGALAVSKSGELASGSDDSTIRIWS